MGPGRGRRQLFCYNYGGLGHYAHDCTNPTRPSCLYYTLFDHEMEDCPTLIARLRNKGALEPPLTQNLQMMRSELCKEDRNNTRWGFSKNHDGEWNGTLHRWCDHLTSQGKESLSAPCSWKGARDYKLLCPGSA